MDQLSLNLFGAPQIEHNGELIKINRRKAIALLAYLAVTQQSHSRDTLATMFWPESNQSRSRAALRSALWTLNKTALAKYLIVEPEMVTLRPSTGSGDTSARLETMLNIDVIQFRDLLSNSQHHDHSSIDVCEYCFDLLTETVSLYENDFMAGFTLLDAPDFDEWQFFQTNTLRQNLVTALEGLIKFHSTQGNFSSAIPYARRYVSLDMLHEPAHRTLMQLYAQAGQHSAAIRQYKICRETLESELGLVPSEETKTLYKRIHSGVWKKESGERKQTNLGETTTTSDRGHPKIITPHNLPLDPTPLIGRQQELTRLTAFIDDQSTRLLTIVGPGGIGKTRLALAAAADQISKTRFPDGIYFISLTPLSEPEGIIPAIAEAVGYPFQPDQRTPRKQILDYLSGKSTLLLLDNFEHLLLDHQDDGATMIADLLQSAPNLKILATSRERLNLHEEQRYPLQGLAVQKTSARIPGTEYPAGALFLQTVRRRQPDYKIASDELPFLADICHLVEGMPLALELAASWIEMLSLDQIASKIKHNLDFLETNVTNVPERHRSMQAVFDSSWQSLGEKEQAIYAQLSVFRDGFTQDAAESVVGASLHTLAGLANKSLLRFNQSIKRYETHELLRQFAAEKLGDLSEETRNRHADYFCAYLQQRETDLKGPRLQQAMIEIETDSETVSDAWNWAVEQCQTANLAKSLVPLSLFYQFRGRFGEGEAICRTAINKLTSSLSGDDDESQIQKRLPESSSEIHLLVKLLTWQGRFNMALAQYDKARQALRQAQVFLNDLNIQGRDITATLAFLLLQLSDHSMVNEFGGESEKLSEESLDLFRSIDDAWGTALALDALSQTNMNLGLHDKAIQQHEECLAIRHHLQDKQGIARSYNILGLLVLHVGQLERSEAYLRKSLSIFRTMDNPAQISNPLAVLGINLLFGGKFEECIASYQECWAIHRELSLPQEPFTANVGMTRAKINLGRYEEARMQAQSNLATYRSTNHRWSIAFTLFNLGRIDLVNGAVDQALHHLQESAELLHMMNERSLLPDVLFCLAYTFRMLNDQQKVVEYMIQSLIIAIETEPLNPMRFELPAMALLLADQGQHERAVELYEAALQSPYIANSRWFEDIAGRHIAEIAAKLPQDIVLAAQERGQVRDIWTTANEVLAELSDTWQSSGSALEGSKRHH